MAANEVGNWVYSERFIRSEKEYLKLLCAYEEWLKEEGY
jgi:hypothetical protein